MFRPRVIPVLLLKGEGLVKSVKFKKHKYIGDPINAVRIFNDLKADEIVFLDIEASLSDRSISIEFVRQVSEEANMPFIVGGGIKSLDTIQNILSAGAEKVIIGSYAIENPDFIKEAVDEFGSSTVTVCLDVKKNLLGKKHLRVLSGSKSTSQDPRSFALKMESMGAGELVIQSMDRDGTMDGYDLDLISDMAKAVTIPIIALGGAGNYSDLEKAFQSYANGLAGGSVFVYHDKMRGVLINYPNVKELIFRKA